MKKRNVIIVVLLLFVALVLSCCASGKYAEAEKLFNQGEYEEALEIFEAISDYKDADDYIDECENALEYESALELMDEKDFAAAISIFEKLDDFEDSEELLAECMDNLPFQFVVHENIEPKKLDFYYGLALISTTYDTSGETGSELITGTQQEGETAIMIRGLARDDYSIGTELHAVLISSVVVINEDEYDLGALIYYGTDDYYFEFIFAVPDDKTDADMSVKYVDAEGNEVIVPVNSEYVLVSKDYYEQVVVPYFDSQK